MFSETVFYDSPIGILRLSCTEDAISEITFLHDYKEAEHEKECLQVQAVSQLMKDCIRYLDDYFAGKIQAVSFVIKQAGTAFQQSVWSALSAIPYGKTISYNQLSKNIGNVKAI